MRFDLTLDVAQASRDIVLPAVSGEVDFGDEEQPVRSDVLDVQVRDALDFGE